MKRYVYFVMLFFLPITAFALDVFRMDTRSPFGEDGIFNLGFPALGENRDLYLHVEGETCFSGSRDSFFISTSESQDFARRWGPSTVGTTFYVYTIRATSNFYNVYNSLIHAYNETGHIRLLNSANHFQYQEEYAAAGGILPSQIMNVLEFESTGDPQNPRFVLGYTNPNYLDPNDQPSQSPFIFSSDLSDQESACSVCLSDISSSSRLPSNTTLSDLLRCRKKIIVTTIFN